MSINRSYRMCVRCVMDTTHPEIQFDDNGVCNYCHAYEVDRKSLLPEHEALAKLAQIVGEIKKSGKGREYDCILGLSGGVDSSYLSLRLKELGLRALAVHFDNGWDSELAVKNIELLCGQLNMDLFTYVVDWPEFRDLQASFLKASVANVEAPTDHAIFATLYQVAAARSIEYILSGNNIVTEQISVPSYGYDYRDLRQIRGIQRIFGSKKLKSFPQMGLLKNIYYRKIKGIKFVSLLNYMPYDKKLAIQELENQIGWRYYGGKHHESIITRFHQSYILPRKFGVEKRKAHLSNLIYAGQITREDALEELKSPICPPALIEEDRQYVIKKLGLLDEQFEDIMSEAPKNYWDYPNEKALFDFYKRVAQWWAKCRSSAKR